jgi:hypothetical protein
VRLPRRGRAHFTRFARCRLATLQARGPLGCPRRSKLGRGSASGGFLNDVVGAKVWLYNGQRIGGRRTLFVFVLPERGPSFVHVAKWSRRAGGALQLDIQTGTITIGTMPIASTTALLLRFDGRRGSVPFMTSPCGRQWTVTAFYVDGATVTATDTAVCR